MRVFNSNSPPKNQMADLSRSSTYSTDTSGDNEPSIGYPQLYYQAKAQNWERYHTGATQSTLIATDVHSSAAQLEYDKLVSGGVEVTFDTVLSRPPNSYGISIPDLKSFDSPYRWSNTRKNVCLVLSCCATFVAAYSASAYSLTLGPITRQFGISNEAFQIGITTWCVGFAISPMVLAPLSESMGRRPVFLFSGLICCLGQLGCAITDAFAGMLVARFFVGAGASTFATMVGGVISDIYCTDTRNTPMAIYSASALVATGTGPVVSAFIVTRISWRWVFYVQLAALASIMIIFAALFKETRGSVLLARKAKVINLYFDTVEAHERRTPLKPPAYVENSSSTIYLTPHNQVRYTVSTSTKHSLGGLIYLSLTTPFRLLFTEPILAAFSLWAAFAWAVLYLTLNVLPLVFSTAYAFSVLSQGLVFASLAVGTLIGLFLSISTDRLIRRYHPSSLQAPESRLLSARYTATLLPLGLFIFGITATQQIHYLVPCTGIVVAMVGIFSIYLAVFNYLADTYHKYASSALACQSFCRSMLAAVFPLFSEAMFKKLGYVKASCLLGGIAVLLTGVPWCLALWGERIRGLSRVAKGGKQRY